ncbi:PREDICTED: leucine-rich repeat-containing protein 74B-like [Habropoda laboriosa]|uniref:leucine-rich repeat-containing protein 74B-like n=1 Tax=Habropoda laboriosa TaxID=597456 RepID=UPI00083E0798|nr:PREDICTED: leucine-rich repeat-containing protein 74B-like [Habropoda laboriosa]
MEPSEATQIKKERDASVETLITPEGASTASTEPSSESSIHPCLREIEISDSQLKLQNLYTMYPIPDDPGLVPAFWTIEERRTSFQADGVEKFFDLSKASRIKPVQALEEMLLSDKISLQYYGLDSRVIRPLCEALTNNPFVHTINLTGNWLSADACYHLSDLLRKNSMVHTLVLSGCKIGAEGAAMLHDGILHNTTLRKLDLSDCNIRNEGLDYIANSIDNIETLTLNDNHLDESCSDALLKLLSESSELKRLELSWNSLYTVETWIKLVKGLEENNTLVDLDLSWNALGKECVLYLRRLLLGPSMLKRLYLNGNRFIDDDTVIIARGLSKNETLEELYIGNNPLKANGAFNLVNAVTPENAPESSLRILDLTNVWANKKILAKLEVIKDQKPWLDVKLGGILSNYKLEGPDVKTILLKRANYEAMRPKKKRLRRNFGHFVLSLSDDPISRAKFVELIKKFRLKLSQTLIREITIAFAATSHTIDQELLKSVYMKHYPDTKPPPEKKPARKEKLLQL